MPRGDGSGFEGFDFITDSRARRSLEKRISRAWNNPLRSTPEPAAAGTSTSAPSTSFQCPSEGWFPDPKSKNCKRYFICSIDVDGRLYVSDSFRCPFNLIFDPLLRRCNWKRLAPPCKLMSQRVSGKVIKVVEGKSRGELDLVLFSMPLISTSTNPTLLQTRLHPRLHPRKSLHRTPQRRLPPYLLQTRLPTAPQRLHSLSPLHPTLPQYLPRLPIPLRGAFLLQRDNQRLFTPCRRLRASRRSRCFLLYPTTIPRFRLGDQTMRQNAGENVSTSEKLSPFLPLCENWGQIPRTASKLPDWFSLRQRLANVHVGVEEQALRAEELGFGSAAGEV